MDRRTEEARQFARDLLALAEIMEHVEVPERWYDGGATVRWDDRCPRRRYFEWWLSLIQQGGSPEVDIHVRPDDVIVTHRHGEGVADELVARIRAVQAEIQAERDRQLYGGWEHVRVLKGDDGLWVVHNPAFNRWLGEDVHWVAEPEARWSTEAEAREHLAASRRYWSEVEDGLYEVAG